MSSTGGPSEVRTKTASGFTGLVAKHRGRMGLLASVSFIGALLEAFFLVIITGVAMALVGENTTLGPVLGRTISVGNALLVAAAVLVFRLTLSLAGVAIGTSLTAEVTTDQRRLLSHAYLRTAWAIQQAEPAGRLQELLTTFVQRVRDTVSTLTQAITALLSLVAFLAVSLAVDLGSTAAVLLALTLVGGILTPLRRRIRRRSRISARASLNFANAVSELGALGLEMQTFGVQSRIVDRIDDLTREATHTERRVQTLYQSLAPVYMALAYAAVLAGVGILTLVGFDNVAIIGAVMLLMLRSLSYGQQLATAAGSLSANTPFLDQVRTTVEAYEALPAQTGELVPVAVTPIEARAVEFAYDGRRTALSSATFRIDQGEVVGIIGPSGAGKSTLAQLLLGLHEPATGELRVAGINLSDVDRKWWSERVAFVAQDARLLTGTVAENIRFFREGINDSAMTTAAAQANILNDIQALPDGFDTHLGEHGNQLSGGQRQRLSIARALAARPEFIVLDEPTSALDGASESLIRDALARLKGAVTVVIIAHRMSTLDICDRIMVIESGRITDFDSPAALQLESEFYRNAVAVAGLSPILTD